MRLKLASAVAVGVVLCGINLTLSQERLKRPMPRLPEGVRVLSDLAYVADGHERNRLDLYLPEKSKTPLPVVMWIHGGAWRKGSKEGVGPALPLVAKGYAVASINYRLSQHAMFPAQIEDCKAAIRWLRANATKYQLDANHIGVWGSSAGGHLVALLGVAGGVQDFEGKGGNPDLSSRVQAVVDWFGPSDLTKMGKEGDKPESPIAQLIGGTAPENVVKAQKGSPLTYVSKDAAPFLIMHGDQDPLVPLAQSEALADALKKAGAEVTLNVVKGAGHGGPKFNNPDNLKVIEQFFDRHLRPKQGASMK